MPKIFDVKKDYQTILMNQMSEYHHKKVSAAQDIIRSILNDSITDKIELRNWLNNLGGIVADKQIISSYMQEKNYSAAQNLLNMFPTLYVLEGDDLLAYFDYKTIVELQINLAQQGRNIFELNNTELATLENLTENGYGGAKTDAQGILEYAYGGHYCNCLSLTDSTGLKSSSINYEKLVKVTGLEIEAEPNPASSWVAFNYKLPVNEPSAIITISDANGKVIERINISGLQGQYIWDARKVKAGVYIYSSEVGRLSKKCKLIIK